MQALVSTQLEDSRGTFCKYLTFFFCAALSSSILFSVNSRCLGLPEPPALSPRCSDCHSLPPCCRLETLSISKLRQSQASSSLFVNWLSEITVLHCRVSKASKILFHIHCLIFFFPVCFQAEECIQFL
uniref:Uncharacterized protein n=1 Tax=Rousettus aegyptiacus TaxID=9407 RepID=A0A7J8H135_ROUAE|nr:hypothetical protein HJG63_011197 [Rousettus aegyptiacus]